MACRCCPLHGSPKSHGTSARPLLSVLGRWARFCRLALQLSVISTQIALPVLLFRGLAIEDQLSKIQRCTRTFVPNDLSLACPQTSLRAERPKSSAAADLATGLRTLADQIEAAPDLLDAAADAMAEVGVTIPSCQMFTLMSGSAVKTFDDLQEVVRRPHICQACCCARHPATRVSSSHHL